MSHNDNDNEDCYIGIDVGTASVRACLVSSSGALLSTSTHPIPVYTTPTSHAILEQSTADIWSAILTAVRSLPTNKLGHVKGIGFDATCSLVVVNESGDPLTVTPGPDLGRKGHRNVILWADHRAEKEAKRINELATNFAVLASVGGSISLEMQTPKILWLKAHLPTSPRPSSLFHAMQFFDLPDYLSYLSTHTPSRSSCSLTCKFSYTPHRGGWDDAFFTRIGLEELRADGYEQVGGGVGPPLTAGSPVGKGLSETPARDLGLRVGTPVGSALIDAYAGWLGTIATRCAGEPAPTLEESAQRLALVAGTSTCHLIHSRQETFVSGVWGPYKDVVFPGWYMTEGGQSATGQLIEYTLTSHPAYPELIALAKEQRMTIYNVLQNHLETLRTSKNAQSLVELTKDMHFYPDLHGNRAPLADPSMRGSITGLTLDTSLNGLSQKYYVTLESLALQTRHILSTLHGANPQRTITTLCVSGGQAANGLMMRLLADVCDVCVVLPGEGEEVVVARGAAMLGCFAAEVSKRGGVETDTERAELLWDIMVKMTPPGTILRSSASPKEKAMYEAKYKIFLEAIEIQRRWRHEMEMAATHSTL